ncbi:MAG: type I-E CRISPR-associated protein Cas6/Cse3/CasE [Armatimonadota bacterium]
MIELNPRCRQVQAELADLYQLHRTLSKAFGDGEESYKAARCLFRIDELRGSGIPRLLLQSRLCPDWDRLTVPADYTESKPMIKEFTPELVNGDLLHFRLRANPTVTRGAKRHGLCKEEEQHEWIQKKAHNNGFCILDMQIEKEGTQKSLIANGNNVSLLSVMFEGTLRVTDADEFAKALEQGIGPGKGFGFGLLSIAPVR